METGGRSREESGTMLKQFRTREEAEEYARRELPELNATPQEFDVLDRNSQPEHTFWALHVQQDDIFGYLHEDGTFLNIHE
jgi:hypothetical protein